PCVPASTCPKGRSWPIRERRHYRYTRAAPSSWAAPPFTVWATARCSSPEKASGARRGDHGEAVRVLRRAVELGVDFIDTADSYGPYISEELIAEALYPYPRGLVVATKAGLTRTGPNQWIPVGRPEYLRQECEMSGVGGSAIAPPGRPFSRRAKPHVMLRRMDSAQPSDASALTQVPPGTPVVVGARVVPMPALHPGDRVLAVARMETLVVVSAEAQAAAVDAVTQPDVRSAESRRRSTTRLRVSPGMRSAMIDGLRGWASAPSRVGEVIE